MNKFAQLGLIFFTGLSSILSAQYNQEDYLKFAANEFIEGAKSQAIKTKKPISELGIADDFTNVYSYTYERKGIFFEFQLDEIHKSYDQIKYSLSLNGNTDSLNISYFDVDPLKGFEKKEYSGIAEVVDIKNDAVLFDTGNFSFASYDRKQPSLKSNKEVDLANENLISTLKKLTLILYRTTVVESESVYKLNFFHVWDHISISVEKNDLFFSKCKGHWSDFRIFSQDSVNHFYYEDLVKKITKPDASMEKNIVAITSFVDENIPYVSDTCESKYGRTLKVRASDYTKPGIETLVEGGDCEDKAVLTSQLLNVLSVKNYIVSANIDGRIRWHAFNAVAGDFEGYYILIDDNKFFLTDVDSYAEGYPGSPRETYVSSDVKMELYDPSHSRNKPVRVDKIYNTDQSEAIILR